MQSLLVGMCVGCVWRRLGELFDSCPVANSSPPLLHSIVGICNPPNAAICRNHWYRVLHNCAVLRWSWPKTPPKCGIWQSLVVDFGQGHPLDSIGGDYCSAQANIHVFSALINTDGHKIGLSNKEARNVLLGKPVCYLHGGYQKNKVRFTWWTVIQTAAVKLLLCKTMCNQ